LIRRFLPLARKLARRYYGGGEPLEDLVQVASLGLVKAVERYDERRGVSFSSYAVPTITGELKRYFRDHTWSVHVPRGMRERALDVNRAARDISGQTGRQPSATDIATKLELDEQEVVEARQAYAAFDALSLDAPALNTDGPDPQPRAETLGAEDERFELAEERLTIGEAVRTLPKQERLILSMRYGEGRTQSDIAARIGVSQMQVSRLLRRTLERLQRTVEQSQSARADPRDRLTVPRAGVDRGHEAARPHERTDLSDATARRNRGGRRSAGRGGAGRRARASGKPAQVLALRRG
jgi:RNA polymerase sigma-B factor